MLTIKYQGQFKKDYKLAVRRGCDIKELEKVIRMLSEEQVHIATFSDRSILLFLKPSPSL